MGSKKSKKEIECFNCYGLGYLKINKEICSCYCCNGSGVLQKKMFEKKDK
jgi:hypothetical protein